MKVAILGFGTVGSGVWKVITENQKVIAGRVGDAVEIVHVLDLREFAGQPVQSVLTKDFNDILQDDAVDVVVECMGGLHPAYEFVKSALMSGKSVVTSNKELVAAKGAELLQLADQKNVDFYYEASVGGGIPVIRALRESMAQEEILEIHGILNGTTNYILTRMENEGLSYETVLKDAQELGYAERNPEADVEGHDACRKIAILASMAYGANVPYENIPTEGITKITIEDIEKARQQGKKIRLIARAKMIDGTVYARVSPTLISEDHPLAGVKGVYNGIWIRGNMVDDIMLQGKGAGKEATASAIVSDVITALKNRRNGIHETILWDSKTLPVRDSLEQKEEGLEPVG